MRGLAITMLVGCLAAAAVPTAALAQSGALPTILVLPVDGNDLSGAEKTALQTEIIATMAKYKKFEVLPAQKIDLLDEMVEFECVDLDGDCLSQIGKKKKANNVLYLKLHKGALAIMLVEVDSAKVVQQFDGEATKANVGKVSIEQGLVALFGALPVEPPKAMKVTVTCNEPKAEVLVDGKKAGETPLSLELAPGEYTVTVKKDAFLIWEDKVNVKPAEKPLVVEVKLKPIPKPKDPAVVVTPPVEKKGDEKKVAETTSPGDTTDPGPKDDKKVEEETPFYATWWFWTAVGAAAVTIVSVSVAAASASGDTPAVGPLRLVVNPADAEKDSIFYE